MTIDQFICDYVESELPISVEVRLGYRKEKFIVSLEHEYEPEDGILYLHAETDNGFYVDFDVAAGDLYGARYWEDYIADCVESEAEDEIELQAMHGGWE